MNNSGNGADDSRRRPSYAPLTPIPPDGAEVKACAVVVRGPDLGLRFELGAVPQVVGRSAKCSILIEEETISRRHCELWLAGHVVMVRDLKSNCGSLVNGILTSEGPLRHGDQLSIGHVRLEILVGYSIEGAYNGLMLRLTGTDELTGLATKQQLLERLDKEIAIAHRDRTPLSLVVLDIDHLRQINDEYGWLGGDGLLCHCAEVMGPFAGPKDLLARYGGEELAMVLRGRTAMEAGQVAERFRASFEASELEYKERLLSATVTCGVAGLRLELDDRETLFKRAVQALSAAKQLGGNQVVVDDDGP